MVRPNEVYVQLKVITRLAVLLEADVAHKDGYRKRTTLF
jgi:hypothetical protein